MKNDRGAAATTSTNGPSQLADTAAITIPKIDVDSAAVKALLKTGMSESEEVLEYLGGNIASDLKAAAAKAATRRDLALGPKSKLDETAVNASMDELASRAKAVAPFWVGPGVDDTASPGSERATPARKKAGETTTVKKEPAPAARAPLAPPAPKPPATAPAKPKPVSTKTDAPAKPKPTPPAREANSNHKMIPKMPTLPKPRLPAVDVKLPDINIPGVPELDGVAEDAIRALRVAMSRAPKYDDEDGDEKATEDGARSTSWSFAPIVADGIDKDDPDYREMVKERRRRRVRSASLPPPLTPEEKEARRVERQRLAAERAERRSAAEAERNAAVAKKVADALAAPPAETPSWMNARGTEIFKAVEAAVSKHPKGDAVKKPPSAAKTANASATKGEKPNGKRTAGKDAATEKPGATGTELFDQYSLVVQTKLETYAKQLGFADRTPEDEAAATKARLERRAKEIAKAEAAADKIEADDRHLEQTQTSPPSLTMGWRFIKKT